LCEFLFYSRSLYIVLSSMNTILDKNLSNILALKFKDITKKTQDILASENSNQDLLLFLSDEKIQDLFNDFDFFIKENSFYEGDCKDRDKNIFSKIINNKNKFCKLLKKSSKNLKIYKG
ncbi:hypothetical protein DBC13_07290, partial [Campylobacter jejuni]|nr:hypothetical protein [Campylobacter jejuni]